MSGPSSVIRFGGAAQETLRSGAHWQASVRGAAGPHEGNGLALEWTGAKERQ